jgi:hypothetical protein
MIINNNTSKQCDGFANFKSMQWVVSTQMCIGCGIDARRYAKVGWVILAVILSTYLYYIILQGI